MKVDKKKVLWCLGITIVLAMPSALLALWASPLLLYAYYESSNPPPIIRGFVYFLLAIPLHTIILYMAHSAVSRFIKNKLLQVFVLASLWFTVLMLIQN